MGCGSQYGAGDRIRTDDILLGKQTLCQLSYTRDCIYYIKPIQRFQGRSENGSGEKRGISNRTGPRM